MTASRRGIRVSVVVPTRNEAGNIGPLVRRIEEAAGHLVQEVVFVDDSDDQTPSVIERVAAKSSIDVNLIHRVPGCRAGGLGTAVMEGLRAAQTDWVLVMDGDLQHPPELIPDIVAAAHGDVRAVIASRMKEQDAVANATPLRRVVTKVATTVTRVLFPRQLAGITDPLTGYFLVDRRALPQDLAPDGFKILLEILVRSRDLNPTEVGFTFGDRVSGRSKASFEEGIRFAKLLGRLRFGVARPATAHAANGRQLKYRYDVHGILTVASDAKLPELATFRTSQPLDTPDLVVRIGKPVGTTSGMEFTEWFGWAGFAVRIEHGEQIRIWASRLVGLSPHVLYTNVVEPVLRWRFVSRGHALVHAACVVDDGHAYVVTARTDTGKTTTALKLLEAGGLEFLSDDLSIVTPGGELLTYPKPMTMSNHTVQAVNPEALTFAERLALQPQSRLHSRSGRRVGLGLAKSAFPAATANALVQMMIPPPKYPVSRILPGTVTAPSGLPQHLFVIARGPESKRGLGPDEAAEMLLANCEDAYGFPPYEHVETYMLSQTEGDLRAREADVILGAFAECPATLLQSSSYSWADVIRSEIESDATLRKSRNGNGERRASEHLIIDLVDEAERGEAADAGSESGGGSPEAVG